MVKKTIKVLAFLLSLLIFSLLFSFLWNRKPEIFSFINIPESWWIYLVTLTKIGCCEGTADLAIFVGICFGAIIFLILTGFYLLFKKIIIKNKINNQ